MRFVVRLLMAFAFAGCLELGVRVLAHSTGTCHPQCFTQYDPVLGWSTSPGTVARHRNAALGFDVVYRINNRGFRGPLHGPIKPSGVTRVVVLGDSNAFGWGLEDGHHFSSVLDQLDRLEVINLAVTGYSTDQELMRLENEGFKFNPDVVVLQVTPNDVDDITRSFVGEMPKPYVYRAGGALRIGNTPVRVLEDDASRLPSFPIPFATREWLLWRSYTYRWLMQETGRIGPTIRPSPAHDADALFRDLLLSLSRGVHARHGALVVVHAFAEDNRPGLFEGIPATVIDVSPEFDEARRRGAQPMFADGVHWNQLGHRLVAQALEAVLLPSELPRVVTDSRRDRSD